jgi:hypothetical protein
MASHAWAARALNAESPGPGVAALGLGFLLRIALVAGLFILALQQSVGACLASFAGLMLSRSVLIYRIHKGYEGWGLSLTSEEKE